MIGSREAEQKIWVCPVTATEQLAGVKFIVVNWAQRKGLLCRYDSAF